MFFVQLHDQKIVHKKNFKLLLMKGVGTGLECGELGEVCGVEAQEGEYGKLWG